jgi:short-subunit dehydrogenase
VLTVNPGATATEFFAEGFKVSPTSGLAPVSDVVKATFKALDAKKSKPSVIVGGRNSFMARATRFLPQAAVIKVAGKLFLHD